jgi:hypothetical protein
MRLKIAIAILCLLAFTAVTAYAATIRVSETSYADLGWKKTTVQNSTEVPYWPNFRSEGSTTPAYVESINVKPGKCQNAGRHNWSGISKNFAAGTLVSTITTFKIRTCSYQGSGTTYEPPSIYLGVSNDGVNDRCIRYLPWASTTRGNSYQYYEYDLADPNGKWYQHISGTVSTLSAILGAAPMLQFYTATALPGGDNFHVFNGSTQNQEDQYGNSTWGNVDWVEIGFADGSDYIYDFVVPEPSSILALFTGIVGIAALRRRR